MTIEGVDRSVLYGVDCGMERDIRRQLCSENAWCILSPGHPWPCCKHPGPAVDLTTFEQRRRR